MIWNNHYSWAKAICQTPTIDGILLNYQTNYKDIDNSKNCMES